MAKQYYSWSFVQSLRAVSEIATNHQCPRMILKGQRNRSWHPTGLRCGNRLAVEARLLRYYRNSTRPEGVLPKKLTMNGHSLCPMRLREWSMSVWVHLDFGTERMQLIVNRMC